MSGWIMRQRFVVATALRIVPQPETGSGASVLLGSRWGADGTITLPLEPPMVPMGTVPMETVTPTAWLCPSPRIVLG